MTSERVEKAWSEKKLCDNCGAKDPYYRVKKSRELMHYIGARHNRKGTFYLCIACCREFSFLMGRDKRG